MRRARGLEEFTLHGTFTRCLVEFSDRFSEYSLESEHLSIDGISVKREVMVRLGNQDVRSSG